MQKANSEVSEQLLFAVASAEPCPFVVSRGETLELGAPAVGRRACKETCVFASPDALAAAREYTQWDYEDDAATISGESGWSDSALQEPFDANRRRRDARNTAIDDFEDGRSSCQGATVYPDAAVTSTEIVTGWFGRSKTRKITKPIQVAACGNSAATAMIEQRVCFRVPRQNQ